MSVAGWNWQLPDDLVPAEAQRRAADVATRSQYGWGQTIELGALRLEGFLGDKWERVVRELDGHGWLPSDLSGATVVDVGCFSGAQTLVLAGRGAQRVIAVDEVPEHLDQCRLLADLVGADRVEPIEASLFDLPTRLGVAVADLMLMSGVLYHLSDMLVGLVAAQQVLEPGGTLLVQTNAVESFEHSYANFGRFYAGWWWQPTALCIQDMCELAGLERPEIHFYEPGRCVVRARKPSDAPPEGLVPYKRGMHWSFTDLTDATRRARDTATLAPAPDVGAEAALLRRWAHRVLTTLVRLPLRVANAVRRRLG